MCRIDGADIATVFNVIERTAIKSHNCGECHRIINPQEKYSIFTGLWEGEWKSYKMCSHCTVLSDWLNDECGGYVFGEVLEEFEEHVVDYGYAKPHNPLARAAINSRHQWKEIKSDKLVSLPKIK